MQSLDERTGYLLKQYISGTCTAEEYHELLALLKVQQDEVLLEELLLKEVQNSRFHTAEAVVDWKKMLSDILQHKAQQNRAPVRKMFPFRKMAAAAVLLLCLGAATYFLLKKDAPKQDTVSAIPANDIMPGSSGAILTMANGQTLVLDSAQNGALAQQGNMHIEKKDSLIAYAPLAGQSSGEIVYNSLTTPRGRQFQLVLSDGTKVWLNAASSVHFPTSFAGDKRVVDVTGEVYFEVAPQYAKGGQKKPFIVNILSSGGDRAGAVEVLGTHFNINAYGDEPFIRTTLLEGKVRVTPTLTKGEPVILKPGQQASLSHSSLKSYSITVQTVDLDAVMAWKNGYFQFERADIQTVMRQISRWYDVDIHYEGAITKDKFGGNIPRDATLSQVLHALEQSLVHFRIEGKKVIVMP